MPEIEKIDQPPPEAGHEDRDINVNAIVKFGAISAVVAIVLHFIVAWQWDYLNQSIARSDPRVPAIAKREPPPRLPNDLKRIPEPRLQDTETHDILLWRAREEAILNSDGWDARTQTRHIPIDRAIEIFSDPDAAARRGIRVRPEKKKGS